MSGRKQTSATVKLAAPLGQKGMTTIVGQPVGVKTARLQPTYGCARHTMTAERGDDT